MPRFYVTFSTDHPLCDHWVEIDAPSTVRARQRIFEMFSGKWSNLYSEDNFDEECFPGGRAGKVIDG